ncbi:MAG: ATP-binding protein, partial [Planctomycetes bacterium]|nr:ATP-binding protein [Planctomycetota bacterium]
MPKDYSPFTPGLPVPLEFFVGRLNEVNRLKEKVSASTTGRLEIAFVSGERGIGKSSLASFVRFIAERDDKVIGVHTFLGGVTSLEEMVRRVFERLLKDNVEKPWFGKLKEFFGTKVSKVGLFGVSVEFAAQPQDLKRLVDDFPGVLRNLMRAVQSETRGLCLVLDDINGLASSPAFADWLKSFIDETATSGERLPLCLVLVGLEERRRALIDNNPSLARVFDLIDISAWDMNETSEFYTTAFEEAGATVQPEAMRHMTRYAGGLPVLAHEIGDAVFKIDRDGVIDREDALKGIIEAADIVGRKYLEPQVFQLIRSPRYRAILRRFAQ